MLENAGIMLESCWKVLESCWKVLESCWKMLESCWKVLESCWKVLESCWNHAGIMLENAGTCDMYGVHNQQYGNEDMMGYTCRVRSHGADSPKSPMKFRKSSLANIANVNAADLASLGCWENLQETPDISWGKPRFPVKIFPSTNPMAIPQWTASPCRRRTQGPSPHPLDSLRSNRKQSTKLQLSAAWKLGLSMIRIQGKRS